jgi:outer membrane protein assembly factor BamB
MFNQKKSVPWYRSPIVMIAAIVVILLGAVVGFLIFRRSGSNEAHYAALEQHRQQQSTEAPPAAPAATATPVATASPDASASPTQPGVPTGGSGRNYWTTFRGAKRDGTYALTPVSTSWPANGLSPIWKQPIGLGFASFAIADGRAFTLEQRRGQEVAVAYDVATGRELWTQAWTAEFYEQNGAGPRATPTWDQGRVYALGATGELRCLDANSGSVIWGKNILTENQAENLPWAMAASPLVVDDKVIVLPGGNNGKSVVAYNKMTGAPVWNVLNDTQAYVSPMLVELNGRRQIMVVSSSRVVGLVPENGALLWSYSWNTDSGINVSQPVVIDQNRFFISSGYGKGAALV